MADKNKNVLVVAYACEPNKTSEPGVGWNFSKEVSKLYNTIVLTRSNNQINIETQAKDEREFIYYDLPKIFKIIKKRFPLGTQLYYLCWQWGAYTFAKKHLKNNEKNVDIVHHMTFGTSWITPPSFMFKTQKFIWGPIGGGDFIPMPFLKEVSLKSFIQESIYYLVNQGAKLSPFAYKLRHSAKAVIFRTKSSYDAFGSNNIKNLDVISETASSDIVIKEPKVHSSFINAMCVGRLTYWKGFIYAVKGFHRYLENGGKGKLEILGDGPELKVIRDYVDKHNLDNEIILRGFVDNSVVKESMKKSNVLMHPSFRDGGSWAIMEGMTYGLPVICLDTSGPKDMVTSKCGALLKLENPDQLIEDISNALDRFSSDDLYYLELSKNAQNRIANEYTWEKRGKEISKVYENVLNEDS